MLDEHESPLDHGDFLGVLRLPRPLRQRPAALRTRPRVRGQRVPRLDARQGRLRRRPVAGLWGWCRVGARLRARSLLGGIAEQRALSLGEQLAEKLEVNLGGGGVLAAQLREFGGQLLRRSWRR